MFGILTWHLLLVQGFAPGPLGLSDAGVKTSKLKTSAQILPAHYATATLPPTTQTDIYRLADTVSVGVVSRPWRPSVILAEQAVASSGDIVICSWCTCYSTLGGLTSACLVPAAPPWAPVY